MSAFRDRYGWVAWAERVSVSLRPVLRRVLRRLAEHADEDGFAWPSVATLTRALGLSPATKPHVRRALRELELRGFILCIERGGGRIGHATLFALRGDREAADVAALPLPECYPTGGACAPRRPGRTGGAGASHRGRVRPATGGACAPRSTWKNTKNPLARSAPTAGHDAGERNGNRADAPPTAPALPPQNPAGMKALARDVLNTYRRKRCAPLDADGAPSQFLSTPDATPTHSPAPATPEGT